ncbi:hypothetical protein BT69DRAFT_1312656 [Atractiella rhizophila]|nr:hypothetical protein BT69DRAFT_1312656 [Atractiella rhizophila]
MRSTLPPLLALAFLFPSLVLSQGNTNGPSGEGGALDGPTSSPQAAGYTCDASQCKLPNCQCAQVVPPGGLAPTDVPQFVTLTADDAVQKYTIDTINGFLAHRRNPNGCAPKMTYFTSLNYTNYSMVTDWFVAGNEIADHTMTHVGIPPSAEIQGNLKALNSFSGIPLSDIIGFRAPYLSYSADTLTQLHQAQFTYDSSSTSATPCNNTDTDCFWPYTLDYGMANDCLNVEGICQGQLKLPGLWEIPMYGVYDERQQAGVHLMDPYLDSDNQADVQSWLQNAFTNHYEGNRAPFGLYFHPIHLATGYPGVPDPVDEINMVNAFLDWVQQHPNVWIVSNAQMLAWLKNPVTNANIASVTELGCSVPSVTENICNGMYPNEVGLLENCPFVDFPWTTCYGCPIEPPTPANPVPPQSSASGVRYRLPANCSTAFFDPIKNRCLCQDASCKFEDQTRPIGNYTQGGTGSDTTTASPSPTVYQPFNNSSPRVQIPTIAIVLSTFLAIGMSAGLWSVFA